MRSPPAPAPTRVEGGSGDDTIEASDGAADTVTCGIGIDTVTADAADVLFGDCEIVTRVEEKGGGGTAPPLVTPPPADTTPIDAPPLQPTAALTLRGTTLRVGRGGRGRIRAGCTGALCAGTLVLKAGRRTIARARYSVATAAGARVPFRLTRRGRARLRCSGRIRARALAGAVTRRYTLVPRRS